MARGLCPDFDLEAYRGGHMTPVFFGSAISNFGVRELLHGIGELAPSPRPQPARERTIVPTEDKVTGFVFKVQANMDPKHRDRVAFVRLCSGHFRRGMKLLHVRSDTQLAVHNPVLFLAQDRELAEEAFAGDIIGIPNHGKLGIGDALTEGEDLHFKGIPSFAPELLQRVRPTDPMRAKHLGRALEQLAEEGAARIFKPRIGGNWIVGVVGSLQFDVLADRIKSEYEIPVVFEPSSLYTARWVECDDAALMKKFLNGNEGYMADDHLGAPVFAGTATPGTWRPPSRNGRGSSSRRPKRRSVEIRGSRHQSPTLLSPPRASVTPSLPRAAQNARRSWFGRVQAQLYEGTAGGELGPRSRQRTVVMSGSAVDRDLLRLQLGALGDLEREDSRSSARPSRDQVSVPTWQREDERCEETRMLVS